MKIHKAISCHNKYDNTLNIKFQGHSLINSILFDNYSFYVGKIILCSTFIVASFISGCKPELIRQITGTKKRNESSMRSSAADGSASPQVRKFKTSETRKGNLSFNPQTGLVNTDLIMDYDYKQESKVFIQESPGLGLDLKQQGNPSIDRTETFKQEELGIVDIQIVIDNSGSMQEEQDRVKTSLKDLLNYIAATNWQINVTSTDAGSNPQENCSRGLLRKGDFDATRIFEEAIDAGIMGNSSERGVLMSVEGLKCRNWTRKDASTAVLFISDEDNCSDGNDPDCIGQPWQTPEYLLNHFKTNMNKQIGFDARVYGIFWIPGSTCATGYQMGNQYQELVTVTKGKAGSICEPDYSSVLQQISQDLNSIRKMEFMLKSIPVANSVKVTVDQGGTKTETTDFLIAGRVIRFLNPPPAGSAITVEYKASDPAPLSNRFKLSSKPIKDSISVKINGQVVPKNQFQFEDQSLEVVFLETPPQDAEIRFDYIKDSEQLVRHVLDGHIKDGSIKITVDGSAYNEFVVTYGGETTTIQFTSAPRPQSTVIITYWAAKEPLLKYPLLLDPAQLKLITALDQDGKKIDLSIDYTTRQITVPEGVFKEGRKVTLSFQTRTFGQTSIDSPEKIQPDTLEIKLSSGSCKTNPTEGKITFDCIPDGLNPIQVEWSYRTALISVYDFEGISNPEKGRFRVLVGGVEWAAFSRNGTKLEFTQSLPQDTEVEITFFNNI